MFVVPLSGQARGTEDDPDTVLVGPGRESRPTDDSPGEGKDVGVGVVGSLSPTVRR